ncbi:hypothetical protein E2L08_07135 [Palleronia sediminis]|uniref:Uncharacterized protein n=1 Tax=Palleronia sediminis TaxID=2547833 RepID=A0A4R6ADD3_9RHOB|nr:hypothetical protein [Palleronia sediminis]TDL81105.1 hypothetical protein E2L08_07135 [Palleronia sediminis]
MTGPLTDRGIEDSVSKHRNRPPKHRRRPPIALGVILVAVLGAGAVTAVLVLGYGLPLIWAIPVYGATGAVFALVVLAAAWALRRR